MQHYEVEIFFLIDKVLCHNICRMYPRFIDSEYNMINMRPDLQNN